MFLNFNNKSSRLSDSGVLELIVPIHYLVPPLPLGDALATLLKALLMQTRQVFELFHSIEHHNTVLDLLFDGFGVALHHHFNGLLHLAVGGDLLELLSAAVNHGQAVFVDCLVVFRLGVLYLLVLHLFLLKFDPDVLVVDVFVVRHQDFKFLQKHLEVLSWPEDKAGGVKLSERCYNL